MSLMWIIGPLAITYFAGKKLFEIGMQFWIEAKANEWMLLIRNGQMVKKGVGMATFRLPGDQVIRFPTLISQVNFVAEQVSSEMQGV